MAFGYRCFACGVAPFDHSSLALHYEVASLKAQVFTLRSQATLLTRAALKEQAQEPMVVSDATPKHRFFLRNKKLLSITPAPPADAAAVSGLCFLCDDPAAQRCPLLCGKVFCKRCFDVHMEDDCECRFTGV